MKLNAGQDEIGEAQIAVMTHTRFHATQTPVRNQVKMLEDDIEEAATDFQAGNKKLTQTRNDYTTMEHTLTVGLTNLLHEELEIIQELGDKLHGMQEKNNADTISIKKQILVASQLRDKIKADMYSLNTRIEVAEVDVGFE